MYITLISVRVAAALIMIFIQRLRCASFSSSFSELVLALCGRLAFLFSISPLALSPLLSVVVLYRPPSVSPPVLLVVRFPLPLLCVSPFRLAVASRPLLVIALPLCLVPCTEST